MPALAPVSLLGGAKTVPGGFGIYVHWPFCAAKCPYCDFNSHVRHQRIDEARFLAAFRREIAHMARLSPAAPVESVFFGGGTPSLMHPQTVGGILEAIAAHWPMLNDAEVTLEANPSSVEAERFKGYRQAGVNRLSLGVQSLRDADLRALGRLHDVAQARRAIAIAGDVFGRFSFDLIYARPGQSLTDWQTELAEALEMAPTHLSLYQLTIEEGTPFASLHRAGKLVLPDPDASIEQFEVTGAMTAAAGLPAYEISNHARPGEESRHNLVYWRSGLYAGIGPGAHGRLAPQGIRTALANEKHPETWLERVEAQDNGVIEQTALSAPETADEMLIMGLRLTEGLDLVHLKALTGLTPTDAAIARAVADGLLLVEGQRLKASAIGRHVLNHLVLILSTGLAPQGTP